MMLPEQREMQMRIVIDVQQLKYIAFFFADQNLRRRAAEILDAP